ncbi:Hypothetical_protein [Hexamita inflata]|uniref:Hypothetical_protein n=1 Tax=Hexamita inflata TaxID=28002 RepID=A0AA86TRU2_9EUKA|nr:Hypothetical protein HINF_LOCUS14354 [Hexamita inflata]
MTSFVHLNRFEVCGLITQTCEFNLFLRDGIRSLKNAWHVFELNQKTILLLLILNLRFSPHSATEIPISTRVTESYLSSQHVPLHTCYNLPSFDGRIFSSTLIINLVIQFFSSICFFKCLLILLIYHFSMHDLTILAPHEAGSDTVLITID